VSHYIHGRIPDSVVNDTQTIIERQTKLNLFLSSCARDSEKGGLVAREGREINSNTALIKLINILLSCVLNSILISFEIQALPFAPGMKP
jgi:hypothetical protein